MEHGGEGRTNFDELNREFPEPSHLEFTSPQSGSLWLRQPYLSAMLYKSLFVVGLATASAAFQAGPAALRPSATCAAAASAVAMTADSDDASVADGRTRRALLQQAAVGAATTSALGSMPTLPAAAASAKTWEVVNLPIISETPPILFDIEFDSKDPKLGWIVGNRGTFLQTNDGGKSWAAKSFANLDPDEEINYRFTKVSFKDGEGWIIGKPAILLHTRDGGSSWERVPLSPKLPGDPYGIVALGPGKAEMSTSAGAIYVTDNAGRNWKAQVRETIDATLNRVSSSGVQGASYFSGSINSIQRDADGSYLAVSSRGNFYLTYKPGEEFWIPHNRETSRRITSMGFVKDRMVRPTPALHRPRCLAARDRVRPARARLRPLSASASPPLRFSSSQTLRLSLLTRARHCPAPPDRRPVDDDRGRRDQQDSRRRRGYAADQHPLRQAPDPLGRLRAARRCLREGRQEGVGRGRRRHHLRLQGRRQDVGQGQVRRRPALQPVQGQVLRRRHWLRPRLQRRPPAQ